MQRKTLTLLTVPFTALGLSACSTADPVVRTESSLEYGARVRITSQALGPGWHPAVVGLAGECTAVMISTDEVVPSFTGVPFETITAMEISDRYPGGAEPHIYHAGSDTTGERWTALPVDALRERYAGCQPF